MLWLRWSPRPEFPLARRLARQEMFLGAWSTRSFCSAQQTCHRQRPLAIQSTPGQSRSGGCRVCQSPPLQCTTTEMSRLQCSVRMALLSRTRSRARCLTFHCTPRRSSASVWAMVRISRPRCPFAPRRIASATACCILYPVVRCCRAPCGKATPALSRTSARWACWVSPALHLHFWDLLCSSAQRLARRVLRGYCNLLGSPQVMTRSWRAPIIFSQARLFHPRRLRRYSRTRAHRPSWTGHSQTAQVSCRPLRPGRRT
mmetsp:Transcript_82999/g.267460  ORF Transcript_82999/g.267460 Transcript_82999/m.267460 type:complete len:258 (-) Transcript_82999:666-1439(-)